MWRLFAVRHLDSEAIRKRADRREAPSQSVQDGSARISGLERGFPTPATPSFRTWRVVRYVHNSGAPKSEVPSEFFHDDSESTLITDYGNRREREFQRVLC